MEAKHTGVEPTINNEDWSKMDFAGKEFCILKDGHKLLLKATPLSPERVLAEVRPQNISDVIRELSSKFERLADEAKRLNEEWSESSNKTALAPKLQRFKAQLLQVPALGDFYALLSPLKETEELIDALFEENHAHRLKIIEKMSELIKQICEGDSYDGDLDNRFKALREEWKLSPELKKEHYEAILPKFEALENEYYGHKRQLHTEREHQAMQNLDLKMQLCEKAEQLSDSEQWKQATEAFKTLMDEWKAVGRLPSPEKNEELWNRFNTARNIFFERKRIHSNEIKEEQAQNLQLKLALLEKAEELKSRTNWKQTTEAFDHLMEEWRKIGRVPADKADELWAKFKLARDTFFNAKREQGQLFREQLEQNYRKKKELSERAEEVKTSSDWHAATIAMNDLMDAWKNIGPIPKTYGDELWEQFISARKYFFSRKDADRESKKNQFRHQLNNRLHQTTQFLNKLIAEREEDLEQLADFKQSLANTLGSSPKEVELRQHLENLIEGIETRLPKRQAKIEDVKRQQESLALRCKEVNN